VAPLEGSHSVELDAGGMARVSLVRRQGVDGAPEVVAVKEMHAHLARERHARARFRDEARISRRIQHHNVVRVLDVLEEGARLRIVMQYVHGVSLSQLARRLSARGERMPRRHVTAILCGVLDGLHAAHEARGEQGEELGVVHRDVTPRNVLVGADGVPRLIDFGIARAAMRDAPATRTGALRGTPYYMSPEQLAGGPTRRQTDLYLAGLLLWEMLSGRKLSQEVHNEGQFMMLVSGGRIPSVRAYASDLEEAVERVLLRALATRPEDRFATAAEMSGALATALPPSAPSALGAWVQELAAPDLARRAALVRAAREGRAADPAPDDEEDEDRPGTLSESSGGERGAGQPAARASGHDPSERTTAPVRPVASLAVPEAITLQLAPAPAAPARGRRIAGAVLLVAAACAGLLVLGRAAPPPEEMEAGLAAHVAALAAALPAPPVPPIAPATPPAEALPAATAKGTSSPGAAAARPAGGVAAGGSKLGCFWVDDRKIKRLVRCGDAVCARQPCKRIDR
jgi:eukaryotic-like serine/threonine-protein kinase